MLVVKYWASFTSRGFHRGCGLIFTPFEELPWNFGTQQFSFGLFMFESSSYFCMQLDIEYCYSEEYYVFALISFSPLGSLILTYLFWHAQAHLMATLFLIHLIDVELLFSSELKFFYSRILNDAHEEWAHICKAVFLILFF